MPTYRFSDPEWDNRLWYGMGFGREIAVNPVVPNTTPVTRMVHQTSGLGITGAYVTDGLRRPAAVTRARYLTGDGFNLFDPSSYDQFPGVQEAAQALKSFASTDVGNVVLTAFASATFAPLAVFVGPQLASISFATPGLLKGDSITKAWTTATLQRIMDAAKLISGGAAGPAFDGAVKNLTDQLGTAVTATTQKFLDLGGLSKTTLVPGLIPPSYAPTAIINKVVGQIDPVTFAQQHGLRPDMVQQAIDLVTKTPSGRVFDLRTGQPINVAPMPQVTINPMVWKTIPPHLPPGTHYAVAQKLWDSYMTRNKGDGFAAGVNFLQDYNAKRVAAPTVNPHVFQLLPAGLGADAYYSQGIAKWEAYLAQNKNNVDAANDAVNRDLAKETSRPMTISEVQTQIANLTKALAAMSPVPTALRLAMQGELAHAQATLAQLQRGVQAQSLVTAVNRGVPAAQAQVQVIQQAAAQGHPQAIADLAAVNTAAMTRTQWIAHYLALKAQSQGGTVAGISRFVAGCAC